MDIENRIHKDNKSKKINEIEKYFNQTVNNKENIIYNMFLIKNIENIINETNNINIPFQFFKFHKENNKLKINVQYEDLFESNNRKLREYIAKLNRFNLFLSIKSQSLKGIILEDLIVSLFMNNKTFQDLKFSPDNIIEIDNIYKYEYNSETDNTSHISYFFKKFLKKQKNPKK